MRLGRNNNERGGIEAKSQLQKILARGQSSQITNSRRFALFIFVAIGGMVLLLTSNISKIETSDNEQNVNRNREPKLHLLKQRLGQQDYWISTLKTSNIHNYSNDDIPFWDETVVDYRTRLRKIYKRGVRPGTIFVSIASFRDNLCQDTLLDALTKAKDATRVFLGVCDQLRFDDPEDIPCVNKLTPELLKQTRLVRIRASSGRGPTHARYIASKLWDGEELFLQIDGHSHFIKDWDELLLENVHRFGDTKVVLTHYPASSEQQLGNGASRPWICQTTTEKAPEGLIIQIPNSCGEAQMSEGIALVDEKKTTCFSPFIGAGFFAGSSRLLLDVPYDKYLKFLFHGEELLIAARLFTSGWDLVTPAINYVAHAYGGRDKNVFVEVPTWHIDAKLSESRARTLLQIPLKGDVFVQFDKSEMADLGVGSKRSLAEYYEYAGLDFKHAVFTPRCRQRFDQINRVWVDPAES